MQSGAILQDVLARIDRRLKAVGLKESAAAVKAGLSDSAIRNMRRALKDPKSKRKNPGASIKTIDALACPAPTYFNVSEPRSSLEVSQ